MVVFTYGCASHVVFVTAGESDTPQSRLCGDPVGAHVPILEGCGFEVYPRLGGDEGCTSGGIVCEVEDVACCESGRIGNRYGEYLRCSCEMHGVDLTIDFLGVGIDDIDVDDAVGGIGVDTFECDVACHLDEAVDLCGKERLGEDVACCESG